MQLAHAGRKASVTEPWNHDKLIPVQDGGWKTVAPSPVAFSDEKDTPLELNVEEIKKIVSDFKAAAVRALAAGFKIIEIHGAHGYLINEFLSPLSNKRTEEYGGSYENRARFLLEIIASLGGVARTRFGHAKTGCC